jgi:hypothetical protein
MMATEIQRSYGEVEIQRGLLALACANGNSRKASRDLAEDGIAIPHSTLAKWKTKNHASRYNEIRAEVLPRIREQTGDEHLALARMQLDASAKSTEAFMKKLEADELDARDLSTAARNFDVGSGIHTQNSSLLHGEPTSRPDRGSDEILRELAAFGLNNLPEVIAGSATEETITDAEEVSA